MIELLWIKSLFNFAILLLSVLLGMYYFKRKRQGAGALILFFAVLSFSQSIELTTNVIWIREKLSFARVLLHLDFVLYLLLGPLLWLYVRDSPLRPEVHWHFLPALILILIAPFSQNLTTEIFFGFFLVSQVHFALYTTLASINLMKFSQATFYMLIGLVASRMLRVLEFILWQTFDLISEPTAWILYTLAETVFVLVLSFFIYRILTGKAVFKKSMPMEFPVEVLSVLDEELGRYLSREEVYSDPLLTVKKVGNHFKIGPHYVSRYINTKLRQSFSDVVNGHRIRACMEKLGNPIYHDLSIQDVYYSAGFNSKSVFYTAFKKATGITPSEFRKRGESVGSTSDFS